MNGQDKNQIINCNSFESASNKNEAIRIKNARIYIESRSLCVCVWGGGCLPIFPLTQDVTQSQFLK